MKRMFQMLWLPWLIIVMAACGNTPGYQYESVPGDPMNARIYTLDNGLKVYMTVNKVFEQMMAALLPHHPYGTQTVLGTQGI